MSWDIPTPNKGTKSIYFIHHARRPLRSVVIHLDSETQFVSEIFYIDFFLSIFIFLESDRSNLSVLGLPVDDFSSNI
jgi:hypothetical protein